MFLENVTSMKTANDLIAGVFAHVGVRVWEVECLLPPCHCLLCPPARLCSWGSQNAPHISERPLAGGPPFLNSGQEGLMIKTEWSLYGKSTPFPFTFRRGPCEPSGTL